jgi:hypothetical protein
MTMGWGLVAQILARIAMASSSQARVRRTVSLVSGAAPGSIC